jgi:hypothetical protein
MPVTVTTIATFNGADGADPGDNNSAYPEALFEDAAGDFFGEARNGGTGDNGTVFKISYLDGSYASTPTALVEFNGTDGSEPEGTLVADANGDLFGITQEGGTDGEGTIFEIPYVDGSYASTPTTLVNFDFGSGSSIFGPFPNGGLIINGAGDLIGVTSATGDGPTGTDGTVYEIAYLDGSYASTPTTLYNFTNGQSPAFGSLVQDAASDLFDVTIGASDPFNDEPSNETGTVFEIPYLDGSYASTPIVLGNLAPDTLPVGPVSMDAAGDLFGVTEVGGPGHAGTVFEIPKTSTGYGALTTLVNFQHSGLSEPDSGLVIDSSGNLFGTTAGNAVFEIANTGTGYAQPTIIFQANSQISGINGALLNESSHDLFLTISGSVGTDGSVIELGDVPCYCRGTLILTDEGERPVEGLAVGDRVMTVSGAARPIRWVGRRSFDGRFICGNRNVLPVVVSAGALGDGVPARDLWLSPEHALYIDKLLVPARLLVNGMTITQVAEVEKLEYFHIELDPHDVIVADGAPAETYLECGNRRMFHNAAEHAALYPHGLPQRGRPCALRVGAGLAAAAIHRRLVARAMALGHRLTDDPGLHLIADGVKVAPLTVDCGMYRFSLDHRPSEVLLASRKTTPAEIDAASRDRRRLGVNLHRISLRDTDWTFDILPDNPHLQLQGGFHASEGDHRWTDGMALLPSRVLALFAGAIDMEVVLGPSELRYPLGETERAPARGRAKRRTGHARHRATALSLISANSFATAALG